MAHTWDREMMRLHHRIIEDLEKQNMVLREMLADAIAALAQKDARKREELTDTVPPKELVEGRRRPGLLGDLAKTPARLDHLARFQS